MKKLIFAGVLFFAVQSMNAQSNFQLQDYVQEISYNKQKQPSFIKLNEALAVKENDVAGFINSKIFNNGDNKVAVLKSERDDYGFTHIRYSILQKGLPIYNRTIIAHCLNGKLVSLSGELRSFEEPANNYSVSEKAALASALKKINAKKYKWENTEEEQFMRVSLSQPDFSYYPTGIKTILEKDGNLYYTYQFTIYAEEPLYKANVFVDAATGNVLDEKNLICTVNVPGSAATKYSGTQTVSVDQNGAVYRLRETVRGLGVETYNMHNSNNYAAATDFTNATAAFTGVGADQGARDAHWGAEKTYDYYFSQHNRNSVNNAGYKLLNYVHYNTNYTNAFWDGTRMTYGDGNSGGGTTIFTALDVCGHEITHGLTQNTAQLDYNNESGALNESFSDIFGTCIENYSRPGNWNWKIGEDLTTGGVGLRNMSNPGIVPFNNPDTYMGNFWATGSADNGGVHTNSGVGNFWFYLLTAGGSGANDLGNAYSVSGLGFTASSKIAFRALTVYFTTFTDYPSARALSIQAAKDLYGDCSNEVIQTIRAWYAVGIGANFVPGTLSTNFSAISTNFCALPATINFNNLTPYGITYAWDFGDGSTATASNVAHTYTANGTYSVKLKAIGCANVTDSITKPSYIVINVPTTPVVTNGSTCGAGQVALGATGNAVLNWYASPSSTVPLATGNTFNTPNIGSTTTYYVENAVTYPPAFGGKLTFIGGGNSNATTQYLEFDVGQNCTLNSVVVSVQAGTAGNRIIELRDSFGNVWYTTTVNLSVGTNTVTLNYLLTPGVNYQLGLGGTLSNMFRSSSGVTYPYNIGGCVSITGSSAGNNFYYWFYNWKVTKEGCTSGVVPVTASINTPPTVSLTLPLSTVCNADAPINLAGNPAGGTFSGQGVTGTIFDPVSASTGSSAITYTYTDSNGCIGMDMKTMEVSECTGIASNSSNAADLSIYPNPVTDRLTIKNHTHADLSASVADASGRLVLAGTITAAESDLNTTTLAKGMYILSIRDTSGNIIKTMKIVKE